MKNTKRILGVILVLAMIGTVVTSISGIIGRSNEKKEMLAPIQTLITTMYFHEGTYNQYKSIFLSPDKVLSEDRFENVRKYTSVKDYFQYDNDSPKDIMKHMVIVKEDSDAKVYYLKDINSKDEMKTARNWTVVNKGDKWLIAN